MRIITEQERNEIVARACQLATWRGKRTSYHSSELPDYIRSPTNDERSAVEVFEFCKDPPKNYFLYINEGKCIATTWTGEELGHVTFGKTWCANTGDTRISVRIRAINGKTYSGTYFKSAGSYARVKVCK